MTPMKKPDTNKGPKEYSNPLTIFEAINHIKGSVPIIEANSDNSKDDDKEKGKGEDPNLLFPVRLLF
jgi:hypothetical protein